MKAVLSILYYLFVAALLAIALLFLATLFPIPGNIQAKIVKSGSMEPTIRTGSILIIRPEAHYAVGDIVTFGKDTKTDVPTTHRIVAVRTVGTETYYTTRGDANEDNDSDETNLREIIGKKIITIPYLGYIIDFARKPVGFILLIVVPALAVMFDEAMTIYREIKTVRRKKKQGPPIYSEYADKNDEM